MITRRHKLAQPEQAASWEATLPPGAGEHRTGPSAARKREGFTEGHTFPGNFL